MSHITLSFFISCGLAGGVVGYAGAHYRISTYVVTPVCVLVGGLMAVVGILAGWW